VDLAEAASVPVVFLTATTGLVDLARLRAGESMLVHAGAGGVEGGDPAGQASGVEVYAPPAKAKVGRVASLGVDEATSPPPARVSSSGVSWPPPPAAWRRCVLNSLRGSS